MKDSEKPYMLLFRSDPYGRWVTEYFDTIEELRAYEKTLKINWPKQCTEAFRRLEQ